MLDSVTHVVVNAAMGCILLAALAVIVTTLAGWLGSLYSWLAPKEESTNGGVGTLQVGGGLTGLPPCPAPEGQGDDQAAEGVQEAPAAGENKELTEVKDSQFNSPQEPAPQPNSTPPPPGKKAGEEGRVGKKQNWVCHTFFHDPSTGPCDPKVAESAGQIMDLYAWLRQAGFSHEEAEQYMANDTRPADAKGHRGPTEAASKAHAEGPVRHAQQRLDQSVQQETDIAKQANRRLDEINKAMAVQQGINNERLAALERSVELLTALTDKLRKKLEALEADARPPLPGAGHQPAAEQTGAVPTHQPRAGGSYGYAFDGGKLEIAPPRAGSGGSQAGAERPRHDGYSPDAMITARAVPAPLQGGGKSDLQATLEYITDMVRAAQEALNTRLHHASQNVPVSSGLMRACEEAEGLLAEQFRRVCNSYEEPLRGVRCDVSDRKPTRG